MGTAVLFVLTTWVWPLSAEQLVVMPVVALWNPVLPWNLQHLQRPPRSVWFPRLRHGLGTYRIRSRARHHAHREELTGSAKNASSEEMIHVRHLAGVPSRGREGDASKLLAVDDVSFTLRRGKTLAVVGGSGSGKSTREHDPPPAGADLGKIFFDGETPRSTAVQRAACRLQAVFQNPTVRSTRCIHDLPDRRALKIHGYGTLEYARRNQARRGHGPQPKLCEAVAALETLRVDQAA